MSRQIIDLAQWFQTPAGRYLQDWELQHCDQVVTDCFGYHALQIGGEHLPLLRNCRVQRCWLAGIELSDEVTGRPVASDIGAASLLLEPTALPFAENSLDLVVLPHTLEASADPHATLREVARVLVPEGRLIVLGFNPGSFWGLQQANSVLAQRLGSKAPPFIPDIDDLISLRRLRDWLRLLNLEVEGGRFGCYRPGLRSEPWFERMAWLEKAGDRWWPMLGGVYLLQAVKRVYGVRMLQPRWKLAKQAARTAGVVAHHGNKRPVRPGRATGKSGQSIS